MVRRMHGPLRCPCSVTKTRIGVCVCVCVEDICVNCMSLSFIGNIVSAIRSWLLSSNNKKREMSYGMKLKCTHKGTWGPSCFNPVLYMFRVTSQRGRFCLTMWQAAQPETVRGNVLYLVGDILWQLKLHEHFQRRRVKVLGDCYVKYFKYASVWILILIIKKTSYLIFWFVFIFTL